MNTRFLLPLSTAALLALAASAMILSPNKHLGGTAPQSIAQRVIDLPVVKVTPNQADLAYYRASQSPRIVDFPAVKVTPEASDLAAYQAASRAQRVITLATVSVRPALQDLAVYLAGKQHQIASQEADVVRRGAAYLQKQITEDARAVIPVSR